MTCRFELEAAGKPYPKSCPTCGLAGKCHKDYAHVKHSDGGYHLTFRGIPLSLVDVAPTQELWAVFTVYGTDKPPSMEGIFSSKEKAQAVMTQHNQVSARFELDKDYTDITTFTLFTFSDPTERVL